MKRTQTETLLELATQDIAHSIRKHGQCFGADNVEDAVNSLTNFELLSRIIDFRGCPAQVSCELNEIVENTRRGLHQIRANFAHSDSEVILFLGHRQYLLLCSVNPADAYALQRGEAPDGSERFMGCKVVRVMQNNYLRLVAKENLIGG